MLSKIKIDFGGKMKLNVILTSVYMGLGILVLSGCLRQCETPVVNNPVVLCDSVIVPANASPMITVFVHGTRIFPKFYVQELFYSPEGFKNISQIEKSSHMHTVAHALSEADPTRFKYESFYTFGWNGNLDFQERKKAANDLYTAIKEFSDSYLSQFGKRPRVRIITHSHGGNVALNLAAVAKEVRDPLFHVDELILLACPVQEETKNYVSDAIFGRIYSLSSRNDVIQVLDPQGLYPNNDNAPVFSERYFPAHQHLLQAQIKLYGRFILHVEFLGKSFLDHLPAIMDMMDAWYRPIDKIAQRIEKVPVIDVLGKKINIYPKACSNNVNGYKH